MSQRNTRTEEIASAIEDLLYMGAIRIEGDKATVSPQLALIAANVMESARIAEDSSGGRDDVMKLMYYTLLIYMNEQLKMPKSLTVAIGNDLEKHREEMEAGALVTMYVAILAEVWAQNREEAANREST